MTNDLKPIRAIREVNHAAIEEAAPGLVDHAPEEQPRHHEEIRHAEGLGEGYELVQPAAFTDREPDAEELPHDFAGPALLGMPVVPERAARRSRHGGIQIRRSAWPGPV